MEKKAEIGSQAAVTTITVADGLQKGAGYVASIANGVGEKASTADAIVTVFKTETATTLMKAVGHVAGSFPCMGPIKPFMVGIANAIENAAYNKEVALGLGQRCTRLVEALSQVAPNLSKDKTETARKLEGINKAVEDCTAFITRYCQTGFLNYMCKMLSSTVDKKQLQKLDKNLNDCIQDLGLTVGGRQLEMSAEHNTMLTAMNAKFDKMTEMLEKNSPEQMDPAELAEIAWRAGCASANEIKEELRQLGLKMDTIDKGVNAVADKLGKMDEKLDVMGNKMDEQLEMQKKTLETVQNSNAEVKQMQQSTLAAIMALAEKTGNTIPVVWSNISEVDRMKARVEAFLGTTPSFDADSGCIMCHSLGIFGKGSWQELDGEPGDDGHPGAPGEEGALGADGERGEDGGDGGDGEDGHNGEAGAAGLNASEIEALVSFQKCEDGSRLYEVTVRHRDGFEDALFAFREGELEGTTLRRLLVNLRGGRGGTGGAGGDGGDGGDGGQGGNGVLAHGDGGNGGNGGVGALGGMGGDGGNGGRIKFCTDDPNVLMAIFVDVSAGLGGEIGRMGTPGGGGKGGLGGAEKDSSSSILSIKSLTIRMPLGSSPPASPTAALVPGRRGKNGKAGKTLRKPPNLTAGKAGKAGAVSFCVYGETGMLESSGSIYQLGFSKAQVETLAPMSCIYGQHREVESVFFFGQELRFGPCSPINVGGLSSPPSTLNLCLYFEGRVVADGKASFSTVPAVKGVKFGELPKGYAKELAIRLPTASALKPIAAPEGVFPTEWSESTRIKVSLSALWCVCGIPFWKDTQTTSKLEYDVTVDVPIKISRTESGAGIVAPATLALAGPEGRIVLAVKNNMVGTAFKRLFTETDPSCGTFVIRAQGIGFFPLLTNTAAVAVGTGARADKVNQEQPDSGLWTVSHCNFVPEIEGGAVATCEYVVKLPDGSKGGKARPGARFSVMAELHLGGNLVEYCPFAETRIVPALPSNPTGQDVIFFTGPRMQIHDYELVVAACALLGRHAHFVDFEHSIHPDTGTLPASLWEAFEGKATLCVGSEEGIDPTAKAALFQDLLRHNQAGGALLLAGSVGYQSKPGPKSATERMVVVKNDKVMGLAALGDGEAVGDGEVRGPVLTTIVCALLAALPIGDKLDVLASNNAKVLGVKLVSMAPALRFREEIKSSCCSGKKIYYESQGKETVTVRDMLLVSALEDVQQDLRDFKAHGRRGDCPALTALQSAAFANAAMLETAHALVEAADIYRVVKGMSGKSGQHNMGSNAKGWTAWRTELKLLAKTTGDETVRSGGRALARRMLSMSEGFVQGEISFVVG